MTRKNALKLAITAVKDSDFDTETKNSVIEKLSRIVNDMPISQWSQETILDACQQYIEDTGRPIGLADFDKSKQLPCHTVIEHRFKMSTNEFRDKYFPLPEPKIAPTPEELKDYLAKFKADFEASGARRRDEYDKMRPESAPCSAALLRFTKFGSWHELLHRSGVIIPPKPVEAKNYSISFTMQYWNDFKAIDEKEAGLNQK